MKKILLALLFILLITSTCYTMTQEQWNFAQSVLKYAYEAKKITGLPASITASQCILESGWGKHTPPNSNNYFGIKSDGTQPYVTCYTYEYYNGEYIKVLARFRKYDTFLDSLIDYGNFIYENPRYWRAIVWKHNPIRYIKEIHWAGYATGLNYTEKVIRIAELCKFLTREKWKE